MFPTNKTQALVTVLSIVGVLFAGAGRASAGFELNHQFATDVAIETLTVRITVGADGEDLAEPVERFTIAIEPTRAGGVLKMSWDLTSFSVPMRVVR